MKISRETLHQLIENKLCQAGLKREHAATVAEVLVYADARGIHSHGAVRVEYYAERISKGGTNREPEFRLEETGPCSAILHADNAAGQVAAKMGMEHAIKTAQQNGVAVVGISRMGHSGAISYFVQQAARAGLIGISMCQSDPMVVPFGGAESFHALVFHDVVRKHYRFNFVAVFFHGIVQNFALVRRYAEVQYFALFAQFRESGVRAAA